MALQHLRSSTANKRPLPAGMSDGQLAVNTNLGSPGLFFKDSNGDLVKVGPVHVGATAPNASPAAGGATGNTKGEQWLDTSGTNPVLKVWDGSAWQSEAGEFVNASGDTMTGALVMDNQQQVRFRETTANGTNYVAIQAPASVGADRTLTLPDVSGTIVSTGDTGTVTSTMIADGTIVNGDINASAAIAGTKISPDFGSQTVTTTGVISAAAGSAGTPSIAFTGDLNTGIYSPGADQVAISTNSTGRLFIDSSGRVGIGATPGGNYLLEAGSTASASARSFKLMTLTGGFSGGDYPYFGYNLRATGSSGVYNYDLNDVASAINFGPSISFSTAASGTAGNAITWNERLRITSAGLVGVGTSTPVSGAQLTVAGSALAVTGQNLDHSANSIRIGQEGSGAAQIRCYGPNTSTNGSLTFRMSRSDGTNSQDVVIDGSGRLGIGTSAPATQLDVRGALNTGGYAFMTGDANINGAPLGRFGFYNTNASASANPLRAYITSTRENSAWGADLQFFTSQGTNAATSKLVINESGQVGIGTSPGRILHVDSGSTSNSYIRFTNSNSIGNGAEVGLFDSGAANPALVLANTMSDGTVVINTNGFERLRVTETGLVGIGTSTPLRSLHVAGAGDTGLMLQTTAAVDDKEIWEIQAAGNASNHADLIFRTRTNAGTGGAEALRITNSGAVGIGTTPSERLHVSGGNARFEGNYVSFNNNGYIRTDATNELRLQMGSSGTTFYNSGNSVEYARLTSDGKWLVGTSTSASGGQAQYARLQVEGNTFGVGQGIVAIRRASSSSGLTAGTPIGQIEFTDNAGEPYARIEAIADGSTGTNDYPSRLVFSTTPDSGSSPVERVRINQDGVLGVLSYAGNGIIVSSNKAAATDQTLIAGNYSATSMYGGTTSFIVRTNGNVQNTNNSYTAISDIKLKENIVDAGSQWDDIKALQVRNYNLKEGQTHRQIGLIAQEVEPISPGLVYDTPDRDADGNDLGTTTKVVQYSVLYMKAVKALQEAMERIEVLEQRLADAGIA